jgi:WD40 repeat protein
VLQRYGGHNFGTTAVAWQPKGTCLASAGQDGKIRLWNSTSLLPIRELEGGAAWVEHLAWSPDGQYLASAAGRKLRLWDSAGNLLQDYPLHNSTIADIAWKPNSTVLTSASYSTVRFFEPAQAEVVSEFSWKGSILVMAWSPNGRFIATGDQDATVHFWFAESGEELQMWGYTTKVRELSWDCNSRYLATGGGAEVVIWDCKTNPAGTKPLMLRGHETLLSGLAFQHHGDYLASGDTEGNLYLWQPKTSTRFLSKHTLKSGITQIKWASNDKELALGTEMGSVSVLGLK